LEYTDNFETWNVCDDGGNVNGCLKLDLFCFLNIGYLYLSKVLSLFLRRGGLYNGCFPKEWGSADINKVWEKLCFNVVQERLIVIVESVYPVFFCVDRSIFERVHDVTDGRLAPD